LAVNWVIIVVLAGMVNVCEVTVSYPGMPLLIAVPRLSKLALT